MTSTARNVFIATLILKSQPPLLAQNLIF